jgi:hypothetical protein
MRVKKNKIADTKIERISLEAAQSAWEILSNFDLQNFYFADFASYWAECEKLNRMTEEEFYEVRSATLKRVGLGYLVKGSKNVFTKK